MPRASDLVFDSKLEARIERAQTIHIFTDSIDSRRRPVPRLEHWSHKRDLGQGGFGRVRLEECTEGTSKGNLRAVKIVRKQLSASRAIDYNRELEAVAKFSHKRYRACFVESFGWYESDDTIHIAMEYLSHGDLHSYLRATPRLPPKDAAELTLQIIEGLHHMHANGFAHRDVKPGNILIKEMPPQEWWIKLADFGISKRAEDGNGPSTIKGTRGFMAPELQGFGAASSSETPIDFQAADMWAAGEVTFRMLAGEDAFPNLQTFALYCLKKLEHPTKMIETSVGQDAADLVARLMAREPEARDTASEALQHPWLREIRTVDQTKRMSALATVRATLETLDLHATRDAAFSNVNTEPSARWSAISLSGVGEKSVSTTGADMESFLAQSNADLSPEMNEEDFQAKRKPSDREYSDKNNSSDDVNGSMKIRESTEPTTAVQISSRNAVTTAIDTRESPMQHTPARAVVTSPEPTQDSPSHDAPQTQLSSAMPMAFSKEEYQKVQASMDRSLDQLITLLAQNPTAERQSLLSDIIDCRNGVQGAPHLGELAARASRISGFMPWPSGKVPPPPQPTQTPQLPKQHPRSEAEPAHTWRPSLVLSQVTQHHGWRRFLPGSSEDLWKATSVVFSPDGGMLASFCNNRTVNLWDSGSGRFIKKLTGHADSVTAVAFSPNNRMLASASSDKFVMLREIHTGAAQWTLKHDLQVRAIAFSPDGSILASGCYMLITLWEVDSGEARRTINCPGFVNALAFSPDGRTLAAIQRRRGCSIAIWDVSSGSRSQDLSEYLQDAPAVLEGLAFSPDGKLLATTTHDGHVPIYALYGHSWVKLTMFRGHVDGGMAVAFSPDGRILASASRDKTVRLWGRMGLSFTALQVLEGHSEEVHAVAFSPDGATLASASLDKTVRLWRRAAVRQSGPG